MTTPGSCQTLIAPGRPFRGPSRLHLSALHLSRINTRTVRAAHKHSIAGPGLEPGAPGFNRALYRLSEPADDHQVVNRRGRARTGACLYVRQVLYQLSYAASLAHRSRDQTGPVLRRTRRCATYGLSMAAAGLEPRGLRVMNPARTPLLYAASASHSRWLGLNQQPRPYEGHALPLSYTVR